MLEGWGRIRRIGADSGGVRGFKMSLIYVQILTVFLETDIFLCQF